MTRTISSAVVVAALLLCRSAEAQCSKDTDCKGNRICVRGACTAPAQAATRCKKDADCPGDQICDTQKCVAGPDKSTLSPAQQRKAAEAERRRAANTKWLASAEEQQARLAAKWRQAEEQQLKAQRAQLARLEAQWKARWAKTPQDRPQPCRFGQAADCTAQCGGRDLASCYALALMSLLGREGRADLPQAAILLAETCNGGNKKACSTLASMLELGKGVPRDLNEACRRGSTEACRRTRRSPPAMAPPPLPKNASPTISRPPARPAPQAADVE